MASEIDVELQMIRLVLPTLEAIVDHQLDILQLLPHASKEQLEAIAARWGASYDLFKRGHSAVQIKVSQGRQLYQDSAEYAQLATQLEVWEAMIAKLMTRLGAQLPFHPLPLN